MDEDQIIAWAAADSLIDETQIADVYVDVTISFYGLSGTFRLPSGRRSLIELIDEIQNFVPSETELYEPDVYDIARDRELEAE